jgi:hypothetical protein
MKLSAEVLLEIVNIVQKGILEGIDVSEMLREIDLDVPTVDHGRTYSNSLLLLSEEYKSKRDNG